MIREHEGNDHMVINCMVIGKGRTEGVSRDEQNRNKGDNKIRVGT